MFNGIWKKAAVKMSKDKVLFLILRLLSDYGQSQAEFWLKERKGSHKASDTRCHNTGPYMWWNC